MKTRNTKHLSPAAAQLLRSFVDDWGMVETLRTLGQITAHDHPDLNKGMELRSRLFKIAAELEAE